MKNEYTAINKGTKLYEIGHKCYKSSEKAVFIKEQSSQQGSRNEIFLVKDQSKTKGKGETFQAGETRTVKISNY